MGLKNDFSKKRCPKFKNKFSSGNKLKKTVMRPSGTREKKKKKNLKKHFYFFSKKKKKKIIFNF
jgi:hypothetical protein